MSCDALVAHVYSKKFMPDIPVVVIGQSGASEIHEILKDLVTVWSSSSETLVSGVWNGDGVGMSDTEQLDLCADMVTNKICFSQLFGQIVPTN